MQVSFVNSSLETNFSNSLSITETLTTENDTFSSSTKHMLHQLLLNFEIQRTTCATNIISCPNLLAQTKLELKSGGFYHFR